MMVSLFAHKASKALVQVLAQTVGPVGYQSPSFSARLFSHKKTSVVPLAEVPQSQKPFVDPKASDHAIKVKELSPEELERKKRTEALKAVLEDAAERERDFSAY